MRAYTVEYKEHSAGDVKSISILANSKQDAWERAVFDLVSPAPYSAWVAGVTYQNGNYKAFNAFEGKPY
jgi:hypothetical protein